MSDFMLSLRFLRRYPGASLAAIVTLALAIGAAVGVFSVVHAVLLHSLPFPEPDRIVQVWQVGEHGGVMQTSEPNYQEWEERQQSFEALARYQRTRITAITPTGPVEVLLGAASREFLDVYGIEPRLGRWFVEDEQQPGAADVAVVSHRLWENALGAETDLSQLDLRVGERRFAVAGVLPPGFEEPGGALMWIPAETVGPNLNRTGHNWRAVARLLPGTTVSQAQEAMHALARWQVETWGDETWLRDVRLVRLHDSLVGEVRQPLLLLQGAGLFLLLIGCANAAGVLLSTVNVQRRELAIRAALGGSRWHLLRIHLGQGLLLAILGGALGLAGSALVVPILLRLEPGALPRFATVGLHPSITLFATLIVLGSAVGVALIPFLAGRRQNLVADLADGGRGGGSGDHRIRSALVVGQIALTVILLTGSGLLGRSFVHLLEVDPGFSTREALTLDLALARPQTDEDLDRLVSLHRDLAEDLAALPGVTGVGAIDVLPAVSGGSDGLFFFEGQEEPAGEAEYRLVTPGFLEALGVPLISGRLPGAGDDRGAPHVAVISQKLRELHWPDASPIGQRIEFGNMDGHPEPLLVVGIVDDILNDGLLAGPRSTIYVLAGQRPNRSSRMTVVVTAEGDPGALVAPARELLRQRYPELVPALGLLSERFSGALADRRFHLALLGLFAVCALVLAMVGLFGVAASAVAQQRRDIGIRMALGATPASVRRGVLHQGLRWAGVGLAIGVAGSLALTRVLDSLLVGLEAHDPTTFVFVVVLLLGTTLAACLAPASRAASLDPSRVLREE